MENNNSNNSSAKPNDAIVLGTLKKEKSSKPIFVLIVFALLIATVFMLPNIKKYMATNDNTITRFYNNYLKSFLENDTSDDYYYIPQTTTTQKSSNDISSSDDISDITCASGGDQYVYHFENLKLKKINHSFSYAKNQIDYSTKYEEYKIINAYYNTLALSTSLTENDEGFTFENAMDLSKVTPSSFETNKNGNYYDLDTNKETLVSLQKAKGFDCQ